MNPFVLPQRSPEDPRPLCPWECKEHEEFYAEVDNSLAAFQVFQGDILTNPGTVRSGGVVLVAGGEGCGKTALIHRCASWLFKWLTESQAIELIILDLTREGLQGTATPGRVDYICDRIIDLLELKAVFTESELNILEKRRRNPALAYPMLGEILANNQKSLAILLPSIEVVDELKYYVSLAKQNIIFFAETSYDQVGSYCTTVFGQASSMPVICLSVGVLSVDDGWTFVKSRVEGMRTKYETIPELSEKTITRLMEVRIKGRGKATVRELQMVCLKVFEQALVQQRTTIEYADFADYYTMKASLI